MKKIAITGSSGLVGTKISEYFRQQGYSISPVIRCKHQENNSETSIFWDIKSDSIDFAALEGHDIVIHLAGANIAGQRWTDDYKREIRESRVKGTKLLCQALAKLKNPPKVLFSASAVGFYGSHAPLDTINEGSNRGDDFLSDVCVEWEEATKKAEDAGIRVVHMRFGTVLSKNGGALAKMNLPFQLGLGGRLGSGEQMFSWIALDEIPNIINFLIEHDDIKGAVNFVSPQPVSNAEFTKDLGKVMRRPTVFPVPSFGVKALFGEMGDALLLNGAKVLPKRLLDAGYHFQYSELSSALERVYNN